MTVGSVASVSVISVPAKSLRVPPEIATGSANVTESMLTVPVPFTASPIVIDEKPSCSAARSALVRSRAAPLSALPPIITSAVAEAGWIVSELVPLTDLAPPSKFTSAAVRTTADVVTTSPPYDWSPVVVTSPPSRVSLSASVVKLPSPPSSVSAPNASPPTFSVKTIAPLTVSPDTEKLPPSALSNVDPNTMSP